MGILKNVCGAVSYIPHTSEKSKELVDVCSVHEETDAKHKRAIIFVLKSLTGNGA